MARKTTTPTIDRQTEDPSSTQTNAKRTRVLQKDVPSMSLDQALRIPRALAEHYAYQPTPTLGVASALNLQPGAGPFRMMCGAAVAYGLIKGGAFAEVIELDELGTRIVKPLSEEDDLAAKREALLRPRIVGEFLRKYNNAPLPRRDIGQNVLHDMGVPKERTSEVLDSILSGADSVGFLRTIKDKQYVDLAATADARLTRVSEIIHAPQQTDLGDSYEASPILDQTALEAKLSVSAPNTNRRVFVTHGKNTSFIDPIKRLLAFGELEPVVAAEKQTVSLPVPDKVMDDMRTCGAAIIHIDAEMKLLDTEAQEHVMLNPNVLIEIGAAMALYGRRFILLVKEGVKLPSNLQGLFEVRYSNDSLDGDTTIRLLEAIQHLKSTRASS